VLINTVEDLSGLDAQACLRRFEHGAAYLPFTFPSSCNKFLAKCAFGHLVYPLSRRIWVASAILLHGSMSAESHQHLL